MKKYISLLLLFLFFANVFAQEDVADYKKFEALAKEINDIQKSTNGKRVKDANTDLILKVPENNFIFNYYDMTATTINGTDEGLLVFENIDLADINDIGISDENYGDCGMIIINPNKKQKYTALVKGETLSQEIDVVAFYFQSYDRNKGNEMFNALSELILLAKVKKGNYTKLQANTELEEWRSTEKKNTAKDYYHFWNDLPNNIFTGLAYYRLQNLDKSFNINKIDLGDFKLGMTKTEFEEVINKRLNDLYSENKVVKEAIKKYRVKYLTNKDGLLESRFLDFSSVTTDMSDIKISKNRAEIKPLEEKLLFVSGKDFISNIYNNYEFKLLSVIFDSSQKLTSIRFRMFPVKEKYSNASILANFTNAFGDISYQNNEKSYFVFSGYSDKEMILSSFRDDGESWITLSNK